MRSSGWPGIEVVAVSDIGPSNAQGSGWLLRVPSRAAQQNQDESCHLHCIISSAVSYTGPPVHVPVAAQVPAKGTASFTVALRVCTEGAATNKSSACSWGQEQMQFRVCSSRRAGLQQTLYLL